MKLTIAIPTYNRNAILQESLQHLLPQLTSDCCLRILDNCSEIPVAETLRDLLASYPDLDARVLRNRVNIGAGANILRCYEQCETEWLWVLGDDDQVAPQAVETVFRTIHHHPDCLYINFLTPVLNRERTLITCGLEEFLAHIDCFGNLLCISASLYRVDAVLPNLRLGYHYGYSMAGQMALLLASLGDQGRCCLSHERLIVDLQAAPVEQQWSLVDFGLGLLTLLELPIPPAARHPFARILARATAVDCLIDHFMSMMNNGTDPRTVVYLYDQIMARHRYVNHSPRRWIKTALRRLILRYPTLGKRFLASYRRTRGLTPIGRLLPSRLERV